MIFWSNWLKPISNWSNYKAKKSLNTKWRQISMVCFHFSEQKFPRIFLKKVSIVSVQHFILSIPDYHHINFQWFPHFLIIIPILHGESLGYNQSKWPWHSFVCSVATENDHLSLMLSCWCSIDLLIIFFFVLPLYTDPHEHFNSCTPG